jgi:NADPH:quinone reductase
LTLTSSVADGFMLGVVADPTVKGVLEIRTVPVPETLSNQVLVQVKAFSLNAGETRTAGLATSVQHPGWDFAGIIVRAATDGSSPPVGTRVVGAALAGSWSQFVAARTSMIAPLPLTVSFSQACTLPVAGLTAWLALEQRGFLLGMRVLVTGAAGGVGRFASQLASIAGGQVVALSRREGLADLLRQDGNDHAIVARTLEEAKTYAPFDFILDSVGGPSLSQAMIMLAKGGLCVTCGNSSNEGSTFDPRPFYLQGGARLHGLFLASVLKERDCSLELGRLVQLLDSGQLRAPIEHEWPWTEIQSATRRLTNQTVAGKITLLVPDPGESV